jgi:hypothetical protein
VFTSIDAVKGVEDPSDRAAAAAEYLRLLHDRERTAIHVRDEAIRASRLPAPELARRTGVSVGTIKVARRGRA